ncbi:MAG TPA: Bax inhibitor-1/YccA family protein [Pseudomonadales bacterium]|jgi:modulator of FtsH protease|nr:Bax inhibitor-1/YccA family protein [Pseudomonadales bacterium]MDP6315399.1 Bax inhibitor-1/YccA family protein [Pseudomonadales bacterium]MDP7315145.1 Bax inhibitor-1/YccA family protein [Pseudomonadales bacterium]HJP50201.1 Bax inhibitor-1/YccA family protein [Pseudomonadales bacterium]|tara:strand:+ start:9545 stop:10222 length:678 start_codon:yes stop_codon:yes gene_type:complete
MADAQFVTERGAAVAPTHKVLRNTYMLLSMTLLFSAAMAALAMAIDAPYMGFIPLLVAFALIFAISKMRNSVWGILLVFAFTGILGFSLGPLLNYYMATSAGTQTVITASALTGIIFLSLSGYTLISQKDFSYMSGFLMTGLWVVIGSMLLMFVGSFFGFYVSGLHLAISAAIVLLMSGFILYDTSRILHGGETNYIMATVALYLDIYNLFVSLLHILGAFGGDD